MQCSEHKRYKGKGQPRSTCAECWALYLCNKTYHLYGFSFREVEQILLAHERTVLRKKGETQ